MGIIPNRRANKTIPCFEDLNMLIYGLQKVGKTSFLSGDENSVTIAAEPGSDFLAARPIHLEEFQNFTDTLQEIAQNPGNYSGLIIDTVDALYNKLSDEICKEKGVEDLGDIGFAKGYTAMRKLWESWLDFGYKHTSFRFVSHMEMREVESQNDHGLNEKYSQAIQRFNGKKARWLDATCNCIGYIRATKEGKRVITFAHSAFHAAGDRTGILEGLGNIELPKEPHLGFEYVSDLYRKRAEELGYQVTSRRNL